MPIGVGAPGTPVIKHLRASLDCLARQTFRDFRGVTVAADENIPAEARSLIEAYGADIVWHLQDSYFRPGGIVGSLTSGRPSTPTTSPTSITTTCGTRRSSPNRSR